MPRGCNVCLDPSCKGGHPEVPFEPDENLPSTSRENPENPATTDKFASPESPTSADEPEETFNIEKLPLWGTIDIPDERLEKIQTYLRRLQPMSSYNPDIGNNKSKSDLKVPEKRKPSLVDSKAKNIFQMLSNVPKVIPFLNLDTLLLEDFHVSQPKCKPFTLRRSRMPCFLRWKDIVPAIEENQVTVIKGPHGGGKSTQVPQYIMDYYILNSKGSECKIISVQPNRVCAISLAERVAQERGEDVGVSIGYAAEAEQSIPRTRGSVVFCTLDIFLKEMEQRDLLSIVSHIILDEFQLRYLMQDFILAIFKHALGLIPFKLILLTDDLTGDKFAQYFQTSNVLEIPVRGHKVREYYMEDVLARTRYEYPCNFAQLSSPAAKQFQCIIKPFVDSLPDNHFYTAQVRAELMKPISEEATMDVGLELIINIVRTEAEPGVILVFLRSMEEMPLLAKRLTQAVETLPIQFTIKNLYSQMPILEQRRVFFPVVDSQWVVILSTAFAETTITMEGVNYVIDFGKNVVSNFETMVKNGNLKWNWISKDCSLTRRNRAGRVKDGVCYHLFTRFRYEHFEEHLKADIQRYPLDTIVILAKYFKITETQAFLSTCIEPPSLFKIRSCLNHLFNHGVLDDQENLTPLGYNISKLPYPVELSKMIYLGITFSCLNPIVDIVVTSYHKNPFQKSLTEEECTTKKTEMLNGIYSDHILYHLAIHQFEHVTTKTEYCKEYLLNHDSLFHLSFKKRALMNKLYNLGLIRTKQPFAAELNYNSDLFTLITGIICGSFIPNIMTSKTKPRKKHIVTDFFKLDNSVLRIHPSCVLTSDVNYEAPFFVHAHNKIKKNTVCVGTMVYPTQLALFTQNLKYYNHGSDFYIVINNALKFKTTREIFTTILELRYRFKYYMKLKVLNPNIPNWTKDNGETITILKAIMGLLLVDGSGFRQAY